ncbi:MAG: hypothetical protein NT099_09670 [Candidatus Saganbacteria bacterium]|nr:hypothetical protein [Candidatus Saganbacteria bacterium]
MKNNKGFALVLIIVLVVIIAIIFAGVIPLIAANLSFSNTRVWQAQTIYAAQGGIMDGIYTYRKNTGRYSALSYGFSGTNISYTYGQKQYNFVKNARTTTALNITYIKVSWIPNNPTTETITDIRLGGVSVFPVGRPKSSGTLVNITDTLISAGSTMSNNQFRFGTNMSGKTVTATFSLSDGSSFEAQVYPPASAHLIMKSTGRVLLSGSNYRKRSIEAKYEITNGNIFDWKEVYGHY